MAIYIVLERKIGGLDTTMDGKMLSRHIETLDSVTRSLGVRSLSEFIRMDNEAIADVLGEEVDGIEAHPLQHFSPQEGLTTILALLQRPEANVAIQDLRECERILSRAAENGIGWHFQIDF